MFHSAQVLSHLLLLAAFEGQIYPDQALSCVSRTVLPHAGGVAPLSPQFGATRRSGGNSNQQGSQNATAEMQTTINDAFMREELSLQELTDLACMFSFAESGETYYTDPSRYSVMFEVKHHTIASKEDA